MKYIDDETLNENKRVFYIETRTATFRSNSLNSVMDMWHFHWKSGKYVCNPEFDATNVGGIG